MKLIDALKDPGSQLSVLLASLYDGVYIVDPQRIILHWNKAAEKITGYKAGEVLGKSCKDDILNHIDENGNLLCRGACPILRCMKDGCMSSAKVYPKHASGRRFPVETHVSPLYDEDGSLIGAVEIFRDITQQEEYRILQEKFNSMLRKYVSETTVSEIEERLRATEAISGSRSLELTILYLDVVSFTSFSESHTPDEVVQMLNDLFGVCDVVIRENLGDIDKFIGDAVMATFSDANDAVKAALKLLEIALPEMNRLRRENGEQEVNVRIGINSGLVLQGDVGTQQRMDLTVIGDSVNIAARIEKSSLPNRLMISEACLARLSDDLQGLFSYHHSQLLKGKSEEIKLYIAD